MKISAGSTSVSVPAYFVDDDGGTAPGEPTTGLLFSDIETGGSASYQRQGAARVDFTLKTVAVDGAYDEGGFILVDDTNMPGLCRVDVPNAAFAVGVDFVNIQMVAAGAKNTIMRPLSIDLEIVSGVVSGAGGVAVIAESATITTGTETLTYTATEELDGTTHDVAPDTGNTDFYYQFDVGPSGVATEFLWFGYAQSNNDNYAVSAYNWLTAGFKQIGEVLGSNNAIVLEHPFTPDNNMTGTGANVGKARLQFTSADGTGIFTDRVLCEFTQAAGGIVNGSTVTLGAATTNTNLIGREWVLVLGGQDITGSFIFGASVTGIATATGEYKLEECDIGACTFDNDGHFERCALEGTFTIGQAGTFTLHSCFTESAAAITIDFAAVGATALHVFGFDGEINFKNMAAGDTVHITGAGTITTETCSGGLIDHDGFFEYTDAGGNVTEQQSDIKVAVDAILADTTEIGAAGVGLTEAGSDGDHLTAINLPNQTMDIVGNITGNLSGSAGSVIGAVGSVAGNVDGSVASVTGSVGSVSGAVASVTGNVGGNVAGSVASVTAGVTVTTNNDKSGYSLTADIRLKKNTAFANFPFIMLDTSGDPATGLTITGTVSIDNASFVALTNAEVEVANGLYGIDLAAADLNGESVCLRFTAAGAKDLLIPMLLQTE